MAVSVASVSLCSDSHSMIESAFRGKLSQPSLVHGGRRHLPDVAFDWVNMTPVMVLPSLATALPLLHSSRTTSIVVILQ